MTKEEWVECHGADQDDGSNVFESMVVASEEDIEFEDTLDYIEAWSDKFFNFAEQNKGEPWLEIFLEKFREYANKPSEGGPVFEEWRNT